jgi:hypothetical protein
MAKPHPGRAGTLRWRRCGPVRLSCSSTTTRSPTSGWPFAGAPRTEDVYRSLLRRHILPRWGEHSLVDISGIKAAAWAKDLRTRYSPTTVAAVMKLLSLLLADAAEERLIPANPIRAQRRDAAARIAAANACGPPPPRCWRSRTTPPCFPTPDPPRRS